MENFKYMTTANMVRNIDTAWVAIPFVHRPTLGEVVIYQGEEYRINSIRVIK